MCPKEGVENDPVVHSALPRTHGRKHSFFRSHRPERRKGMSITIGLDSIIPSIPIPGIFSAPFPPVSSYHYLKFVQVKVTFINADHDLDTD